MGRPISDAEWHALFENYKYTARRLEPRDTYNAKPADKVHRQQYLAGELTDFSHMEGWVSKLASWGAQGKRMQRVRVVTEPLSDDAKYLLAVAKVNLAAGDEIRYLPRHRAVELRLGPPNEDYWIFDANVAAIINFDEDDNFVSHELVDDPAEIVTRLHHFDAAWCYSVSREEFAAKHGIVDA